MDADTHTHTHTNTHMHTHAHTHAHTRTRTRTQAQAHTHTHVHALAMKECDGGRRGCWDYAAERPGFSIAELIFIHILCSRRKILGVPHTSSAPRRGGHLVGSEHIRRRASQITRWEDGFQRSMVIFAMRPVIKLIDSW